MDAVRLITVAREYGAGGSSLAELLGQRLGWPVLDADIAHRVAARLGLPEEAVAGRDEHVPSLLERVGSSLMLGTPELLVDPHSAARPKFSEVAAATGEVLVEAGRNPPLVVVGHGGQALFHDRADALHLRVVAPIESRVRRVCGRRPCAAREAETLARRLDADHARYMREHFGRDERDPLLYDLWINTGRIDLADTVEIVVAAMAVRGEAATASA
jgi:cytidylate kinase